MVGAVGTVVKDIAGAVEAGNASSRSLWGENHFFEETVNVSGPRREREGE